MKYGEESCGTIIFNTDATKVLLIRSNKYWQCPKGFREPGETQKETALRETREEVGLKFKLQDLGKKFTIRYEYQVSPYILNRHLKEIKESGEPQYMFPGTRKRKVSLFLVRTNKTKFKIQEEEVDEARWVDIKTAIRLMRYSRQKPILIAALKSLKHLKSLKPLKYLKR